MSKIVKTEFKLWWLHVAWNVPSRNKTDIFMKINIIVAYMWNLAYEQQKGILLRMGEGGLSYSTHVDNL